MKEKHQVKILAENDNTQAVLCEGRYGEQRYVIHQRVVLDDRAKVAVDFVARWAMVAGEPNGEDRAGRQKIRRMTPEELVNHAVKTVELLYEAFDKQGWTVKVPGYAEAMKYLESESPDA